MPKRKATSDKKSIKSEILQFRVTPELKEQMKVRAKIADVSVAVLIEEALIAYFREKDSICAEEIRLLNERISKIERTLNDRLARLERALRED